MIPKRHYGSVSLAIAAAGFVAVEVAIRRGWLAGNSGTMLAAAFEAGTIGGVADWFAVSALFHHVPIPFLGRHTNIIVRQRARITENIVDMVEEQWLAPDVIGAQLGNLVNSGTMLAWLDDPARRGQAASLAKHALALCARELDSPEAASLLSRVVMDQLASLDLAKPIGAWIGSMVDRGEHAPAWTGLLRAVEDDIDAPETRAIARGLVKDALAACLPQILDRAAQGESAAVVLAELRRLLLSLDLSRPIGEWLAQAVRRRDHDPLSEGLVDAMRGDLAASSEFKELIEGLVRDALERWKSRGWKERLLGGGAEAFGALRHDAIAADVLAAVDGALAQAKSDPTHPLRKKLDATLLEFASRLSAGDAALSAPVQKLSRELIERADLGALLTGVCAWLKRALVADTETGKDAGGSLIDYDAIAGAATAAIGTLLKDARGRTDHPIRVRVDAEIRAFASRMEQGEPAATAQVTRLQERFLANVDLTQAMRGSLSRMKATVTDQLADGSSPLLQLLSRLLDGMVEGLRSDAVRRERLDQWLRAAIIELVHKHHDLVGRMVRASLDPKTLSNEQLVAQIESKVGDDLQYIRLNGAIVGGMVGVGLAALKIYAF